VLTNDKRTMNNNGETCIRKLAVFYNINIHTRPTIKENQSLENINKMKMKTTKMCSQQNVIKLVYKSVLFKQ